MAANSVLVGQVIQRSPTLGFSRRMWLSTPSSNCDRNSSNITIPSIHHPHPGRHAGEGADDLVPRVHTTSQGGVAGRHSRAHRERGERLLPFRYSLRYPQRRLLDHA
jgi:hypothetical protein